MPDNTIGSTPRGRRGQLIVAARQLGITGDPESYIDTELSDAILALDPLGRFPVYPREESVDRVVQLLLPALGLSESSPETSYLRQLLLDRPEINTIGKLRTYLSDPSPTLEHQSLQIQTLARRLEAAAHHWA